MLDRGLVHDASYVETIHLGETCDNVRELHAGLQAYVARPVAELPQYCAAWNINDILGKLPKLDENCTWVWPEDSLRQPGGRRGAPHAVARRLCARHSPGLYVRSS